MHGASISCIPPEPHITGSFRLVQLRVDMEHGFLTELLPTSPYFAELWRCPIPCAVPTEPKMLCQKDDVSPPTIRRTCAVLHWSNMGYFPMSRGVDFPNQPYVHVSFISIYINITVWTIAWAPVQGQTYIWWWTYIVTISNFTVNISATFLHLLFYHF